MGMYLRMPVAFGGAGAAGRDASLDLGLNDGAVRFGLPGEDLAGDLADVGAILIEADAADQLLHLIFSQAGIGAGGYRRRRRRRFWRYSR